LLRKKNVLHTMRKFCWAGLLFIMIGGCKPKIPENIIQPDRMGVILYDIHVVDGYIGSIPKQDSAKKVSAAYYKGVYKKFAIDSVVFTKSMDYYYDHPDVLSTIYEKVTANLKKSKDSLDKIQKKISLKTAAKMKLKKDSADKANLKKGIKTKPDDKGAKDTALDPALDKANINQTKKTMPKGFHKHGVLKKVI